MHGWLYDGALAPLEKMALKEIRRKLLAQSEGKVLEIGAGTGLNFSHYPAGLEVTATDPDPDMLVRAKLRKDQSSVLKEVSLANAESLPFADESFDTVVATLVFCSIPNPLRAFQEVSRVLKPGGKVLLLEHVRKSGMLVGGLQDILTPLWKHIAGGCHLNRTHENSFRETGFDVVMNEELWRGIGRLWVLRKGKAELQR